MVEIYLNPDNQEMYAEQTDQKSDQQALRGAEGLLAELAAMGESSRKFEILQAYALMATRRPEQINQAIAQCAKLLSEDKQYVPAILAKATCHMLKSEKTPAKSLFKLVSSKRFKCKLEFWEELEKLRMMMARLMMNNDKKDMCETLCKQVLQDNKSCYRAWSMLGHICEGEGSYKDAAAKYEQAWTYCHEKSPEIGYLLAFNYLKDERYINAINVCHKVLTAFPSYPKIKAEVMDKARRCLRP